MPTGGIKYITSITHFNELDEIINKNIDKLRGYSKYATGQNKEILDEAIESIGCIKNKFEEMIKFSETRDDG